MSTQPSSRGARSARSQRNSAKRAHAWVGLALSGSLLGCVLGVQIGCSSGDDNHPGGLSTAGEGGASGTVSQGGRSGSAKGGSSSTDAGSADTGEAGASSFAGASASGGTGATGGTGGNAGDANGDAAGAMGELAGAAGTPGSGPSVNPFPCPSDEVATKPTFSAVCALTGQWANGAAVPGASGEGNALIGVTPDELTLAWSDQSGSSPAYLVADRQTASASFGAGQTVSGGYIIGLSADGLRLTALTNDSSSLFEITRADRASAFDTQDGSAFALINAAGAENGTTFQDCVSSADDHTLYYTTVAIGGGNGSLYASTRSNGDPWPIGQALSQCELQSHDIALRHPTGVSSDGLTLFYFDGVRGIERAAWRADTSSTFTWFVDLPGMYGAQPNTACAQLYFANGSGALEVAAAR